jgi:hypothetical protein
MKKLKLLKLIVSSLVVASVVSLNPIGASAEWKQDSNGWWNTEGNSWSVGWRQIDGKWYYFGQDGYMVHDTVVNEYNIGSNGVWIQSTQNSSSNSEQDVREITYNQLPSQAKKIIAGTWQDSKLSKTVLEEYMGNINDKSYIGKEVYVIDFPTTVQSVPNNVIVYMGMDNHKIIGYGVLE